MLKCNTCLRGNEGFLKDFFYSSLYMGIQCDSRWLELGACIEGKWVLSHKVLEVAELTQVASDRNPRRNLPFWPIPSEFRKAKLKCHQNPFLHLLAPLWVDRVLRPAPVMENWELPAHARQLGGWRVPSPRLALKEGSEEQPTWQPAWGCREGCRGSGAGPGSHGWSREAPGVALGSDLWCNHLLMRKASPWGRLMNEIAQKLMFSTFHFLQPEIHQLVKCTRLEDEP